LRGFDGKNANEEIGGPNVKFEFEKKQQNVRDKRFKIGGPVGSPVGN